MILVSSHRCQIVGCSSGSFLSTGSRSTFDEQHPVVILVLDSPGVANYDIRDCVALSKSQL